MGQQDFIDDGSFHKACRLCGLCIECGDCSEDYACGVDIRVSEKQNQDFDWNLEFESKICDCCGKEFSYTTYFHLNEDGGEGICHSCWLDDCGSGFDSDFGDS